MSSTQDLFEKLNEAIKAGNTEEIERIKKEILMGDRDVQLDEHLINSLNGKSIYKNIRKIIKEKEGISEADYAKVISSLITHAIIESEGTGNSYQSYGIDDMYSLLGKFITGDEDASEDAKKFIISRYSEFFN